MVITQCPAAALALLAPSPPGLLLAPRSLGETNGSATNHRGRATAMEQG